MTCSSLRPSLKINVDTLGAILVTLTPLVYFNAALRGNISLASEDGILFNVPLRVAAANIMRQGSLPLWNPYIFSGMPLHAAAQGGVLFPLNWFYLFFDAPTATNLMALSTYMVAALGAYLYARRSGSSPLGAIVTSFVWQWCGFMIGQFSHVNIVQTAALLPWLLWAIDGYGAQGKRRWALAVAAIVMLQAFTGHQQTLVYSLLLATAYAIVMWRATRPARNWYLWSLVLLAAGMLLAAVQILPTYELMRNSLRARASFDFFTAFSLPPRFLLTFFAPYLMGGGDGRLFRAPYVGAPFYGEFIGYAGLATLMLAVVAIVLKRDARTKFWTFVAVIAFILALGSYWPLKLYAIVYYVPILNLFRVPARHLMEVDLALAVLAGRGLTALAGMTDRKRAVRLILTIALIVFLLTFLSVTLGRPAIFRLAREAPVTLMRAPELFLPLFFAAVSLIALWWYARSKKTVALCLLVGVIALDLCVWGQSSGWRIASPPPDSPSWNEPPPVKLLARVNDGDEGRYRILTAPHRFDPNQEVVGPMTSRSTDWVLWLQPDLYMKYGIENAAGYDGFGLARYSKLAGDITVWGEFPRPDETLRGPGRELDLLNVKYLLAMNSPASQKTDEINRATPSVEQEPPSTVVGDHHFAETDLGLPNLKPGTRVSFKVPEVATDRVALLTNLSWAVDVPDGTKVGRLRVGRANGQTFDFDIVAGRDTAEWAHDRSDFRASIRHRRATVATSYPVDDARERYDGHAYVSSFALSEKIPVTFIELEAIGVAQAPDLLLTVLRISLTDTSSKGVTAIRREWLAPSSGHEPRVASSADGKRWRQVAETDGVVIYENSHVLPRAWLATETEVLNEQRILETIRTGRLPDGALWEPRRTALLDTTININTEASQAVSANATLAKHEPNHVELWTASTVPSTLVLSENFYPGWRAYIDGKATETLRVNYNLRGVALPAGNHKVSFVYFPKSVLIGLFISLFAASGLMLWYYRLFPQVR